MTAAAPRARFDAGRVGVGLGLALGLALIAFASGGYFPTAWAWGALVSLVVIAALLVLGTAALPSGLGLVSLGGLAGFGVWTWLALLWSDDVSATTLEGQRVLLYVSAFAALLLVVRRALQRALASIGPDDLPKPCGSPAHRDGVAVRASC